MKLNKNKKYGLYMLFFFSYAIIGLILISFYDFEYNEPFKLAAKWMSLPFAAICFYVLKFEYKEKKIPIGGIFYGVFCFCVLVGYSGGYLALINSNFGIQEKVVLSGKVTDKRFTEGGGRYNTGPKYYVKLTLEDGSLFEFEVSNYEFNNYDIGQTYNDQWRSGLLGLLYR
jgi:hypothetical protein